jgi:hypothetical protein
METSVVYKSAERTWRDLGIGHQDMTRSRSELDAPQNYRNKRHISGRHFSDDFPYIAHSNITHQCRQS